MMEFTPILMFLVACAISYGFGHGAGFELGRSAGVTLGIIEERRRAHSEALEHGNT